MSTTRNEKCITKRPTLYLALELGAKRWHLAMSPSLSSPPRRKALVAGAVAALRLELRTAKKKFGLPVDARVVSCYEAGRDGFWLHRALVELGIENVVVDSASIAVDRRARRLKTDRLDADKLLAMLCRHDQGERHVWRVLRVPGREEEDARRPQREWEMLKKDRTRLINRIHAVFACEGIRDCKINAKLCARLDELGLPSRAVEMVRRSLQTLKLLDEQIAAIGKSIAKHRGDSPDSSSKQVRFLQALRGIGPVSSEVLVTEIFGWRKIENRRQLGALGGLNPSPYASGSMQHDQGISKAGSRRVRRVMVELAWGWLLYQADSKLSRWYQERFGRGGPRQRKIGIVALARKLLVALWKYVAGGEIPEGALFKEEPVAATA